jgi:hypothetical protein
MAENEVRTFDRWRESGRDALDTRLGELFRNVPGPESLPPAELARVAARLRSRVTPRIRALNYAALIATGMLAGTGFALASYGVQRLMDAPRKAVPVSSPAPEASPERKKDPARPRLEPPAATAEPTPDPPAKPGAAVAFPQASSGPLGRESELLSRALAKLRRDHDARAALTLLDQHARDFPTGSLRLEADVARVDALLVLGRSSEALGMLERLPIDRLGRGSELRVLRGELRAKLDPAAAIDDFERALAGDLAPALAERALFGRAGSHLRLGDETRGRSDLRTYLERFPNGRFASDARRRLGE